MEHAHETILEIDLNALEHNYRFLRSRVGKGVKLMAVLKAYAYGTEIESVAKRLTELGADYLAVAYTSEGITLRKAGITAPILVFHPQSTNFGHLVDHCLEPNLYSKFNLKEFITFAQSRNLKNYPVHLKFNTGLNRLGFSEEEVPEVAALLKASESVRTASLFSHFAASEDWREREFTLEQIYLFQRMARTLFQALETEPLLHLCNTSAVFNYPEAHFDMVRTGIGLYGYANDEKLDRHLKPVATLKTTISQIHHLKKGDTVSYNRNFQATGPTTIATLPLGYADGISRKYGNGIGGVYIRDTYAPIVGTVCMDMTMVDLTGIECEEGDEVIVFGRSYPVSNLAKAGETISYELLTGISQRVKRVIVH